MIYKHLLIGPGGRGCPCCFPAPGSKGRRAAFRRAKRKEARQALKCEAIANGTNEPDKEECGQ